MSCQRVSVHRQTRRHRRTGARCCGTYHQSCSAVPQLIASPHRAPRASLLRCVCRPRSHVLFSMASVHTTKPMRLACCARAETTPRRHGSASGACYHQRQTTHQCYHQRKVPGNRLSCRSRTCSVPSTFLLVSCIFVYRPSSDWSRAFSSHDKIKIQPHYY